MEHELHELRQRLNALERENLKTKKACEELKKRLNENEDTSELENPWEKESRL